MKEIKSVKELANLLTALKKGQFTTVYYTTPVRVNKFPTDGSAKVHIDESLVFTHTKAVQYNFGENYDRALRKATGEGAGNSKDKRTYIVPDLLYRSEGTQNVCLVVLPKDCIGTTILCNGEEATKEQVEYMNHYLAPKSKSSSPVPYIGVGVRNVSRISAGGEVYIIKITDLTYTE